MAEQTDATIDPQLSVLVDAACSATACLVGGEDGGAPVGLGSGTLVRSNGGRVLLLTAKHVFEQGGVPDDKLRIVAQGIPLASEPFLAIRLEADGDRDVALVLLPPWLYGPLWNNAVSLDQLHDIEKIPPDAPCWLTGFPVSAVLGSVNATAQAVLTAVVPVVVGVHRSEIVAHGALLKLPWDAAAASVLGLETPKGFSGGGVWAAEPGAPATAAPVDRLRLVGVDRSWNDVDELYVEGVAELHAWLMAAASKLDSYNWT